jgi:hypothetical protein
MMLQHEAPDNAYIFISEHRFNLLLYVLALLAFENWKKRGGCDIVHLSVVPRPILSISVGHCDYMVANC